MKIKIIDFLIKLANTNEKLPKKIIYNGDIYEAFGRAYYCGDTSLLHLIEFASDLNDYVEIIEEPKKIEKLKAKYTSQVGKLELANKIDELIDEINNLKEKQ